MSQQTLHDALLRRCEADREKGLTQSILKDLNAPSNQLTLLAVFYHDFFKGGFERFIYNANGVYLPEVADVLEKLKAKEARYYLELVISYCVENNEDYQTFLAGDFSDSDFKKALAHFSSEYQALDNSIVNEIGDGLKKLFRRA